MFFISIWCRDLDNLIGLKNNSLAWHISSDLKRFKKITKGKTILVGKNTYNSFPNRTLPNRKILVLTTNTKKSFLSDEKNHFFVRFNGKNLHSDEIDLSNEIIYLCGGAMIYDLFFSSEKLFPEIVIDSFYLKSHPDFKDNGVFLSSFTEKTLIENYEREFISFEDEINTYLWRKKGSKLDLELIYQEIKNAIAKK